MAHMNLQNFYFNVIFFLTFILHTCNLLEQTQWLGTETQN